jgi:hypothetical protein
MANRIITVEDLMRATYQGQYALQMLGGRASLGSVKPSDGLAPLPGAGLARDVQGDLLKADDPFLTTKTSFFNPIYGRAVTNWLNHEADIWKLLPKTTYQAKGGSLRVLQTDASNFYGQLETASLLGDTDIPDLLEIDYTDPAVMYNHWDASLLAQLKSKWEDSPSKDAAAYLKNYFAMKHASDLNAQIMQETGTLARLGGNFDNFIESIDRVCSDSAEELLLDAGDCDIYGLDRSANEGEAYNDINGGTLRNISLGLLDDMIAECKKYSEGKRFIMLTDETQLNSIEALDGVKQRYTSSDKWKVDSINGVNTRKGIPIGFSVSSYVGAGINVPIFTSKDVHAEAGGNGNIYLLDLDHIEIRLALPTVYMSTENRDFLILDSFNYKYMYLTVAQLCADKFACHGAIKYLN